LGGEGSPGMFGSGGLVPQLDANIGTSKL